MLTHSHLCPSYFSLILSLSLIHFHWLRPPHPASMHSLKPCLIASRHSQPRSAPSACLHHTHSHGGVPAHSHVGWYLLESLSWVSDFSLLFWCGGGGVALQVTMSDFKTRLETCLGEKKYKQNSAVFPRTGHFLPPLWAAILQRDIHNVKPRPVLNICSVTADRLHHIASVTGWREYMEARKTLLHLSLQTRSECVCGLTNNEVLMLPC